MNENIDQYLIFSLLFTLLKKQKKKEFLIQYYRSHIKAFFPSERI